MPKKITALDLLKQLEWSSSQQGLGFGPMGSGNNGRLVRACPCCGGIDPSDSGKVEFNTESHGHKARCPMNQILHKKKSNTASS